VAGVYKDRDSVHGRLQTRETPEGFLPLAELLGDHANVRGDDADVRSEQPLQITALLDPLLSE